jgi:hypothetical protein
MEEIWKDVVGYEGIYQVSNLGNVKSLTRKVLFRGILRTVNERILKNGVGSNGYPKVVLSKDNKKQDLNVHVIMAIAFLGHKNNKLTSIVDHINNIRNDNRLENLQIISHRENCSKDTKKHNRTSRFIGVSYSKCCKKWKAEININGKKKYLGIFENELDAGNAYYTEFKKL